MEQKSKRALSKCMAICSRAEKCVSDIQQKLQLWEIDEDSAQKIIDQLIAEKFIDEERFAGFYVRDKFRFNCWGKTKITFMLKGKGLPNSLIKKSLGQISDNEYLETCSKLIQQKNKSLKATNDYERKMKLSTFAQGRGFEYDVINEAIKQL